MELFLFTLVYTPERGSVPRRCARGLEKDQDLPQGTATPHCPWVLNPGASHAQCEGGLSQICPVIPGQLDPSTFLLNPRGWNWLEMFQESFCLWVCFLLSFFSLLISSYFSPWPLLAFTSFDFEVLFFSSLEYIWWLCRCEYLEDTDKFRVIGPSLFSAPKSKCTSLIHIHIHEYTYQ